MLKTEGCSNDMFSYIGLFSGALIERMWKNLIMHILYPGIIKKIFETSKTSDVLFSDNF